VAEYAAALGLTADSLVEQMRLTAAEGVKADLALRAVADAEGIEVTDEDLDNEIVQLAAAGGVPAGELRRRLERAERLPAVRSDVRKTRALAWLVDHVEVVDEEGHPIDTAPLRTQRDTTGEHPDTGQSGDIQQ
jgi:trigger factor